MSEVNNSLLDVNRRHHVEQLMKVIQAYGDARYAVGVADTDKTGNAVSRAVRLNGAITRAGELHQMLGFQLNLIIKAHDEAARNLGQ